ncbi:glycosyltransferase [Sphingomonas sp. NSE70-1]|uniref:Glycosyltransferase n=1 Tax=Sphingomonas caseinilyticus TaxID=2908205 RepID=A0ABT0RQS3_9SPHN|nr:glycosyltransferase [Sphingomonas caseinilyticus]MCL6697367.1 glycosyltransferase [Sphingomonas caseinilyticus]
MASVSVIITCFNLERYIGKAIESVLAQDCPVPVEIIVVDDCSTDASAAIIQSHPEVRYVRTPSNSGVLLATLEGIKSSSGELIFFLDGDDLWEPDKLSLCVAAFDQDPGCALVTHDLGFIDQDGEFVERISRPKQVLGPLSVASRGPAVIDAILHHRDYVWLGSALGIRRSRARLDEFAGWATALPDPANTYQDWPLAYWVASLGGATASFLPARLFRYRLHGANHSGDAGTADRAVRNFTRAKNTLLAMKDIAVSRELPGHVQFMLESRANANAYLASLHNVGAIRAFSGFAGSAREFLRKGELAKEVARFTGVLLAGPDRFARWAARRSGGRPQ